MKKIGKVLIISGFGLSFIIQLTIFFLGIMLVFGASYILGFRYLTGNTLWGNDAFSFYMVVDWFSKHFPDVPFWFPLQAGGTSFAGYPWLAAYFVVLVSKLSNLELVQAFRVVGFLSVPLTGVGVIAFVWTRLTSIRSGITRAAMGVVAGLIYVASPLAWTWLVRWGFYAESVSHVFIPWILIFFDWFLDNAAKEKRGLAYRLSFMGLIFFWTLSLLTHFFAAISVLGVMAVYIAIKLVFTRQRKLVAKRVFWSLFVLGIAFSMVVGFRVYPYQRFNKYVSQSGFSGYGVSGYEGMKNNTVPLDVMLSLEKISDNLDPRYTIQDSTFPLYVWVLIIPVLVLGWIVSIKLWGLSVFAILGTYITSNVSLRLSLGGIPYIGSIINYIFTGRPFLIPMRVIIPTLAVFGGIVVFELIQKLLLRLTKRIKFIYLGTMPLTTLMVLILGLGTVAYTISQYYYQPYSNKFKVRTDGFPDEFDMRDVWHEMPDENNLSDDQDVQFSLSDDEFQTIVNLNLLKGACLNSTSSAEAFPEVCDGFINNRDTYLPDVETVTAVRNRCFGSNIEDKLCKTFYKDILSQLNPSNWPKPVVSSDISGEVESVKTIFGHLPSDRSYRYDLSGFSGRQIMISPIVNPNSMIQVYINTLDLLYSSHNYLSQVMYTTFPLYQKPGVLTELGKWFGLDYVFLTGDQQEPIDFWESDKNWKAIGGGWREFGEPQNIASWSNKPNILVITDNDKRLYDQNYRFFTQGGIKFDQADIIQGPKKIDSMSQKEINQYDLIFMRGYDYGLKFRAYSKIDNYLSQGGSLIFDTGWQYNIPDFATERAPSWMPFDSLSWQNLTKDGSWKLNDEGIDKTIDAQKLGPLTWEDTSWGVSVPKNLKPWARPILSYSGTPLIVMGEYGKGKVAWMGFNIVPHAEAKDSVEEVYLFNELVKKLLPDASNSQFSYTYNRIHPDKVEFILNDTTSENTGFYFREAYYPDWHAKLITPKGSKKLKITRSGPGMMYVQMPPAEAGAKLVFEIRTPFVQHSLNALAVLASLLIVVYVIYPKSLIMIATKLWGLRIHYKFRFRSKLPKRKVEDEHTNY